MWRTLRTFPTFGSLQVIRKGRGSEGIMKMLREANETLNPISFIKDDLKSCKGLVGRVPIVLHLSLYREIGGPVVEGLFGLISIFWWSFQRCYLAGKKTSNRSVCSCSFGSGGQIYILDVTIKDKTFRLIRVYGPNASNELPAFFRHIGPYVIPSKAVILVGDWNAVLDPNLDRGATSAGTNTLDVRHFREFVERFYLVDKFR